MSTFLAFPLGPQATVAYLGPPGTFTEVAATACQPDPAQRLPCPTIGAVVAAVATGHVPWGVVPVENSVEGGVSPTLDALWQTDGVWIHQAQVLPIRHTLMSKAPSLGAIATVYSHPQALAQCQQWLATHLPQATLLPSASTTGELARVAADPTTAAIGSARAAELAAIPIVAAPINDYVGNCTRFWLLGTAPAPGGAFTSLALSVRANVPGALLEPLRVFAQHKINLTRIESRPTKKSMGDYVFFIDLEHQGTTTLQAAVHQELGAIAETLKIFGSYPLLQLTTG